MGEDTWWQWRRVADPEVDRQARVNGYGAGYVAVVTPPAQQGTKLPTGDPSGTLSHSVAKLGVRERIS